LVRNLNDNVFQNIDKRVMGVIQYKNTNRPTAGKDPLEFEEKEEIASELLNNNDPEQQRKILNNCIDKILVTHRNTRIFLFMLTGPFFLMYMALKLGIKVFVVVFMYSAKYSKKKPEVEKDDQKSH
jgi:hypothetical protein